MLSCRDCRERLNELLDETEVSSGNAALRDLRAHVGGCTQCARDLAMLRTAQDELRAFPQISAPTALRSRVLAALETPTDASTDALARPRFAAAFATFFRRPAGVAWAGGVLVTACLLILVARSPEVQEEISVQTKDSAQENLALRVEESTPETRRAPAIVQNPQPAMSGAKGGDVKPKSPRVAATPPRPKREVAENQPQRATPAASQPTSATAKNSRSLDLSILERKTPQGVVSPSLPKQKKAPATRGANRGNTAPESGGTAKPDWFVTRRSADGSPAPILSPAPALPSASSPAPATPFAITPEVTAPVPAVNQPGANDAALNDQAVASGAATKLAPHLGMARPGAVPEAHSGASGPSGPAGPSAPIIEPATPFVAQGAPGPRKAMNGPSVAMRARSAPGPAFQASNSAEVQAGTAGSTALSRAESKADSNKERQVLRTGAAHEVTLNILPAREWKNAQLRLALPDPIRFSDNAKDVERILWRGDAKPGQNIAATVSLKAQDAGTHELRVILEQRAGETFAPVQTSTVVVDAVR